MQNFELQDMIKIITNILMLVIILVFTFFNNNLNGQN